jgi:hypothetical protein
VVAFEALNMGLADEIVRGRVDGGMTHEGIVAEGGWGDWWGGPLAFCLAPGFRGLLPRASDGARD